ncbi:hypothetical protein WJX84_010406 [Apatococcus fuscideae]|uniref:C3H1-type domain-containing protein n=1 Tax=Apatococcus fuscideae TaxID=2026836 RepID=A0AAW1T8S1_9CHLO
MEYPGFPMGSGGMLPFQANPMMMASMQSAAFQQGRGQFQQPSFGGGNLPDRADSIFFKTRICNKWRDSECPFGDMCNFAHGEHDLRPLPPEGEEILARKFQGNPRPSIAQSDQGSLRTGPPGPGSGGASAALGGGAMGPPPAGLGGGNEGPQAGKQGQQGDPAAAQRFFKTRLCNKFMNTGSCQYGETCKYAHGPSDIRQPNSLAGSEGQGGGHFQGQFPAPMQEMGQNFDPYFGVMHGMPGGPPMPPGGAPGMTMPGMPFGPRPPPGPPPPSKGIPSRQSTTMQSAASPPRAVGPLDSRQAPNLMSLHAGKPVPNVPHLDQIRAMCSLLGLGSEPKEPDSSAAVHAACASIQDGSAFKDSMYADGISRYFKQVPKFEF